MQTPVVLITGASAGIGEALALEYARRGYDMALLARRADRLAALAARIEAMGRRALAITCDVCADGAIQTAVERAERELGRIDTVVANAGFAITGRFQSLAIEDYRRQFETNVFGVLRTARAALEPLKRTRGRLAIVGSVAGHAASPGMSPYAMSKFAVRALADSLREELRPGGVSVTLLSPGFIDSEIRRVSRDGVFEPARPEPVPHWLRMRTDVAARQIARAIERRKPEVVITAHGKLLVQLARHAPWLMRAVTRLLAPRVRKV